MKTQATRCTQRQLAYLAYWQKKGYRFGRGDKIPENTEIPPQDSLRWVEGVITAVMIACVVALIYLHNTEPADTMPANQDCTPMELPR